MLVIREQALESITARTAADFAKEWVVRARSGESPLSAAAKSRCDIAAVVRGIDYARRYDIVGRHDLERFLCVYVELIGSDRAEHAWAIEIIQDPTLSPGYKIDQLEGQFALLRAEGEEDLG
jgi:hypothetical protein